MQNPAEYEAGIDALAERHPELADFISILKAQLRRANRFPERVVMLEVLEASVAELRARLALVSDQRDGGREAR